MITYSSVDNTTVELTTLTVKTALCEVSPLVHWIDNVYDDVSEALKLAVADVKIWR